MSSSLVLSQRFSGCSETHTQSLEGFPPAIHDCESQSVGSRAQQMGVSVGASVTGPHSPHVNGQFTFTLSVPVPFLQRFSGAKGNSAAQSQFLDGRVSR